MYISQKSLLYSVTLNQFRIREWTYNKSQEHFVLCLRLSIIKYLYESFAEH